MSGVAVDVTARVESGARLLGNVVVGARTHIGTWTEINGNGSLVEIGEDCDIASFVAIHCLDSSRRTRGLDPDIERLPIKIGNRVFIGTHAVILGGCVIGDGAVIGAGVVVQKRQVIEAGTVLRAVEPR